MNRAIILMGLPRAGKTTWIENNLDTTLNTNEVLKVVSADYHRINHPDYDPENAYLLQDWSVEVAEKEMNEVSDTHVNLIMDAGSINKNYTIRIINMLKSKGYSIHLVHVKTPVDVCIERNRACERKVPEHVILEKSEKEKEQFNRLLELVDAVSIVKYQNPEKEKEIEKELINYFK